MMIVLYEMDSGGWHAWVPAIQGCRTWCQSFGDMEKNIREAIDACGYEMPKSLEFRPKHPRGNVIGTRDAEPVNDFGANIDWVKSHTGEHMGEWIALFNGELVASDPSLIKLQAQLQDHPQAGHLLYMKR